MMLRLALVAAMGAVELLAETVTIDLNRTTAMKLVGATAEPEMYKGRRSLRVAHRAGEDGHSLVILPGIDFSDGTIDYDFAGDVKPGSPPAYRDFTGLAFRVSGDGSGYECFYQRPLNSKSPDAEQRTHTVQYISLPGFGWKKLRAEFPGRYEAWADITPAEWAHAQIQVKGATARTYINRAEKPVLSVDLKQRDTRGTIALWVDVGTVAHFANLKITR